MTTVELELAGIDTPGMGAGIDSRNDEEHEDVTHPTHDEQVETEWHIWLVAILLTAGVGLLLYPRGILSDIGYLLVAVAVVGWIAKTMIEKGL